jgi:restriction system protein
MVRAGRAGRYFEEFKERSIVGIGWRAVGDLSGAKSRDDITAMVRRAYPDNRDQANIVSAGQLFRFAKEFAPGDRVVTYDPRARTYLCGDIIGDYAFHPGEEEEELRNLRRVKWQIETARDVLTSGAKYSLGSLATIFSISPPVSAELWREPARSMAPPVTPEDKDAAAISALTSAATDQDISALASEAIKDRIAELSWQEMQELVAGLLRAMGYKTTVSPAGPDRGKDIIASPDGFGFQEPRIVVEVKHRRTERMGSQELRSFLGGRHAKDKGLYVSTGGFSKDAYYEAERSTIPLTLLDFESLVEAILEHYPRFDEETRLLLPLKRIYWPVEK